MHFRITGGNPNASITVSNERLQDGVLYADVRMLLDTPQIPQCFQIHFSTPATATYSTWSPSVRFNRSLGPNWSRKETVSRLAFWMPLHALLSADGTNRITVALSDAKTPTSIRTGVCEEDACVQWTVSFFTASVAPLREYSATLRIDTRKIPYYDSISQVVRWWEVACGYTPAYVPEHARLPMNSLWYSYHQQLDVEDILRECELSKAMGMDTVIIDDGWQTENTRRGYAYCGDWKVAPGKIPDMKQFIDRIHRTGMNAILWFSVPYMGIHTENYEHFQDMLLSDTGNGRDFAALDPRYKKVRDFLTGIYSEAVKNWGLDGVKLDFIDAFSLAGRSLEYDERRDYQSLEDAVEALMTEVTDALRAINPEILIEFRQAYIGPAIRKYGNMLRVGDCPNDALVNRQDILNLRLTSGNTPVHSDMLMWHKEDSVEYAALQLASALYSVPQISVKLASLPAQQREMLTYYLRFWRTHRDILLDGKLCAENPESAYSTVCAEKDGKAIITAYTDPVIPCGPYTETIAVNCSRGKTLLLKNAAGRRYRVVNCMGVLLEDGTLTAPLQEIPVPLAGMVFIHSSNKTGVL